jgi:hypothetical protein
MALPEREENDPLKVWLSQNKGSGNVDFGSAFKWVKDVASDARDQVAKIPGVSPAARIAKRSLTEFNNMFGKTLIAPVTRNALALSVDAGTIFEYVAADVYESNFNREQAS